MKAEDIKKASAAKKAEEALDYPGVAINEADKDKADAQLEKEATCTLNNNPRNNDQ